MTAELTLSFDNGPDPDATPQVLDILAAAGVAATFFVIGERLAAPGGQALAERAKAEGHLIGNHTWSHTLPFGIQPDAAFAAAEIDRTQAQIGALSGPHKLFRPYGGGGALGPHLLSPAAVSHLVSHRFTCVLWNAVPGDWKDPDGWPERALQQIAAQPQTLMVLHDLPTGAMRHLARFIDTVRAAGVRIRQDFPDSCVPIRDGAVVQPIEALTSR